ncbi:DUF3139 domain-containing protein [Peribacillus kribbensis]|uniref:DUF3139 domain-containing protein n=1 Tax=Peribacillus kribbensis TaxID=356658 RepID=UPI000415A9CD|nr:DUF3139 domain-containing protein [Peribacillus kribbensis]
MKKGKWYVLVSLVLIGLAVYLFLPGGPVRKYLVMNATKNYLADQGYKEKDFDVSAEYQFKRNSDDIRGTVAYVTFKDNKNIKYMYIQWRKNSKIQQHCSYFNKETKTEDWVNGGKLLHLEAACTERDG